MKQHDLMTLFPTPLAKTTIWAPSWHQQLSQFELHRQHGHDYSVEHWVLDQIPALKAQIETEVNRFARETLALQEHLEITQSWINVYQQGDTIHQHNHANSVVSGTWYWSTPDTSILFHKHNLNQATGYTLKLDAYPDHTTPYAIELNQVRVEENDLLLWPSYLQHSVPAHDSETVRCTLSFNAMPRSWGSALYRVDR